jgi:hypothetical protein
MCGGRAWIGLIRLRYRPVAESCECGNKTAGYHKRRGIFRVCESAVSLQ